MKAPIDTRTEWLEADGLGGFASGTTSGIATRRYHALLLSAAAPPSDRFVLVNGFAAWLETREGRRDLTRHHYAPGVTTDAAARVASFESEPWPTIRYELDADLAVQQEILVEKNRPVTLVRFRVLGDAPGIRLCLRPFLSGRDFHHLHHENSTFRFEPTIAGQRLTWTPYAGTPQIVCLSNGEYRHRPEWYRSFRYEEEAARGLDCEEDLAAPGEIVFDLSSGDAIWLLTSNTPSAPTLERVTAEEYASAACAREHARRAAFPSSLERHADDYFVRRGRGRTVIAGYPWFSDWGRDTFIALRGLALATGRYELARDILVEWASVVSEGMLPNRFPDRSDQPAEYNSVDGSLWYVLTADELLREPAAQRSLPTAARAALKRAILQIVAGYGHGTRFGIGRDRDGLLRAGEPGVQLTWMDAKIDDHVVTPRTGKAVEIQALWINALRVAAELAEEYVSWFVDARRSFEERFWDEEHSALFDVVDVDHVPGTADPSFRPNQVFAVGGLPITLVSPERARRVIAAIEARLLTPLGLRSLAESEPGYRARYAGGVWERDSAYHQGTVWPWLLGPFVEAWIKSHGGTVDAKRIARDRFVRPLREHLSSAGLGHVSEVADAEAPHRAGGCPFQAWSVSELIRLERHVLESESLKHRELAEQHLALAGSFPLPTGK